MTDFYACSRLRSARKAIGMPWAAILEFHGYWHIFTGVGVYIFMALAECLRFTASATKGTADIRRVRLRSGGLWPFMVYLEPADVNHGGKQE